MGEELLKSAGKNAMAVLALYTENPDNFVLKSIMGEACGAWASWWGFADEKLRSVNDMHEWAVQEMEGNCMETCGETRKCLNWVALKQVGIMTVYTGFERLRERSETALQVFDSQVARQDKSV